MDSRYENRLTDLAKRLRPLIASVAEGTCKVISLAVGWKINEGTTTRFLQHSTGFQIESGGNARGAGAVDLQMYRDLDTQVASGDQSFVGAGDSNTASAYLSSVLGGYDNIAGQMTSAAMGFGGLANTRNQMVHGAYASTIGDRQGSRYVGSDLINMGASSIWFPIDLGANGGVEIPVDTVMSFRALVVGTTQGCGKSFGYEVVGVVENDGGITSILGSTVTTLYEDDAAFDCRAQADDPNDLLEIQVQDSGASSDVVAWTLRIDTAEVTYPA